VSNEQAAMQKKEGKKDKMKTTTIKNSSYKIGRFQGMDLAW
jgi:hypothetical protein